jgi:Ca-activated chloride channel family protein
MSFLYPWILLSPLLIWISYRLFSKKRNRLTFPSIGLLKGVPTSLRLKLRKPVIYTLTILTVLLLALAGARPQQISSEEMPEEAHDLMLVIDLSGSMREEDYRAGFSLLNRLEAVKLVLQEFIAARTSDRIGVAAFGTSAFLQSPLTRDHKLVSELLELLEIGMAGEGTAIGDGLGVALKGFRDIQGESKAIILLTDGSNNSGKVSPIQAASVAAKLGIKIHAIGMGAPVDNRRGSMFGQTGEYDEATLKEIAAKTGGVFFNATDLKDLKKVYAEIDALEKRETEEPARIVLKEFLPDLSATALVTALLLITLNLTIFLKIPE